MKIMKTCTGATVAACLGIFALAAATSAYGQVKPDTGQSESAPGDRSVTQTGRSESLSGTLSKSHGVITPKGDIDPGIKVAPSNSPNSTPVIPPSATGGDTAK
jgi:hypothetical protein